MSSSARPLRSQILIVAVLVGSWASAALLARHPSPAAASALDACFPLLLVATWLCAWGLLISASRRPRTMRLRALASTLGLALAILVLELGALLRVVHWDQVFRRLADEGEYGTAYLADPELSFRRIPGKKWTARPLSDIERGYGLARSLDRPIRFTYDRWGYRNSQDLPQADVVLIGDSFVEGWYVSDEETVASRLSEILGRGVANLGVAGYGTLQELRVLETDAAARRPSIAVWFFFEGNDLYNDQEFENALLAEPVAPQGQNAPEAQGLTSAHGWRERSFLRGLVPRLRRLLQPLLPSRAPYWGLPAAGGADSEPVYFADYGAVPWTDYERGRWAIAAEALRRGRDFARAQGIRLLLVYAPTKYRVYRDQLRLPADSPLAQWDVWPLPARFSEFCDAEAIPCIDLGPPLREAVARGEAPYAARDTHWSREGNQLVAELLVETLDRLGWSVELTH